jgi:DNA-binding Lrp family transcriptional regulator
MSLKPEESLVLDAVRNNGRASIRDIAGKTGIAETTARDILHRLERTKVVRGYGADINPEALGIRTRTWLIVSMPDDDPERALEILHKDLGVERTCLLPDRPDCIGVWMSAASGARLAVKMATWAQHGLRVLEQHPLCGMENVGRKDLQEEDPETWFRLMRLEV